MQIGDIFECAEGIFPQEALDLCADGKAYIDEVDAVEGVRRFQVVAVPEPTQEEIEAQALAQAKAERAEAVEALTVEVNGKVFDADETSQARMSVAASSMTDYETNVWVLHDNSIVHVTKSELLDACRKARLAQSAIWTKPYEDASA